MFMQVMGRGVGGDFADGKNRRKHLPSDSENLRRPQAIQVQDYATVQARAKVELEQQASLKRKRDADEA